VGALRCAVIIYRGLVSEAFSGAEARASGSIARKKRESPDGDEIVPKSRRPTPAQEGPRSGGSPPHRRAQSLGRGGS
jgi:hypothetical protein